MKPMTKAPDWEKASIAEICAPMSGAYGGRRHDGAGYAINPKALERRVADIRRQKKRRESK